MVDKTETKDTGVQTKPISPKPRQQRKRIKLLPMVSVPEEELAQLPVPDISTWKKKQLVQSNTLGQWVRGKQLALAYKRKSLSRLPYYKDKLHTIKL